MRVLSSAVSPMVGFYATILRHLEAGKFHPGAFLISLPNGLTLAALQFLLAVAVFERKWRRDR